VLRGSQQEQGLQQPLLGGLLGWGLLGGSLLGWSFLGGALAAGFLTAGFFTMPPSFACSFLRFK
jgi:hypothetical protein